MNVFDAEFDGLSPTKSHCLSYREGGKVHTLFGYDEIGDWLSKADTLIGHNIIRFDIPHLERLLGIKIKARLVDTLALSWYLYHQQVRHGLEQWGEEYGIPKPAIDDWDSLTPEEYAHRCEEDVKINSMLWDDQWIFLNKLYETEEEVWKLIDYLSFKMGCAAEQERSKWRLDVPRCQALLDKLTAEKEEKIGALAGAMPKVAKTAVRKPPAKPYKRSGELSASGLGWLQLMEDQGLPSDHSEAVKVVVEWLAPNPGSVTQVKAWLFGLGWEPETFKFDRNKDTGEVRKIEQVTVKDSGGEIDPGIHRLFRKEPSLELLQGLSILTHRIGILSGFISKVDDDGYVKAEIQGLTNTFRFKHAVVVNLPGVDKAYGEDIRGCLIADDGWELCGADMASLEDRTKQHYMWPYDPDYVKEMQKPDFDPHLDLAVLAGAITEAQATQHKQGEADFSHIRKPYKATNYAAVYGSGAATLARTAGVSVPKATQLLEVYWRRNESVRRIAEDCYVKVCMKTKWLYNPVSGFWMSLRHDKDRFSTLNQSTGVYAFDTWIKHVRSRRSQLTAQMHDEIILHIKQGHKEKCRALLLWAIDKTNDELKLNRGLGIDIKFGSTYSEIH
jgi:hypothetical protein